MKTILHNTQMLKAGHAANFPCPKANCPGKIKNIIWLEGKKNEEKKQKRIEAAIKAATVQRQKPPPAPKPAPKPKVAEPPPAPNRPRNAPVPVTSTFVSTKAAKPTPAQQAAYMEAMKKAAREARAELGLAQGAAAGGGTAAPAARAASPASAPPGFKVLSVARPANTALEQPQQPVGGKPWGGVAAVGAGVQDRLKADLQSAIPGAVFVEKKGKKKVGAAGTKGAWPGGNANGASGSGSHTPREEEAAAVTLSDFDSSAHEMLRGAAAAEGHINSAQSYLEMLRRMGMDVGYADSDDGGEGGEAEGDEQEGSGEAESEDQLALPPQDSGELPAVAGPLAEGDAAAIAAVEEDYMSPEDLDAWLSGGGLDEDGVLWFMSDGEWFAAYPDGRVEPKDGPPASMSGGALRSPAEVLLAPEPAQQAPAPTITPQTPPAAVTTPLPASPLPVPSPSPPAAIPTPQPAVPVQTLFTMPNMGQPPGMVQPSAMLTSAAMATQMMGQQHHQAMMGMMQQPQMYGGMGYGQVMGAHMGGGMMMQPGMMMPGMMPQTSMAMTPGMAMYMGNMGLAAAMQQQQQHQMQQHQMQQAQVVPPLWSAGHAAKAAAPSGAHALLQQVNVQHQQAVQSSAVAAPHMAAGSAGTAASPPSQQDALVDELMGLLVG